MRVGVDLRLDSLDEDATWEILRGGRNRVCSIVGLISIIAPEYSSSDLLRKGKLLTISFFQM